MNSQRKVKTTWSGKVEMYTAPGCVLGSKEKDLHGCRNGVRPAFRRAIHDWEMKFSRPEGCPVAFGFVGPVGEFWSAP